MQNIKQKQLHLSKLYSFLERISKETLGSDQQSRSELLKLREDTILKIREIQYEISTLVKKEVTNQNG